MDLQLVSPQQQSSLCSPGPTLSTRETLKTQDSEPWPLLGEEMRSDVSAGAGPGVCFLSGCSVFKCDSTLRGTAWKQKNLISRRGVAERAAYQTSLATNLLCQLGLAASAGVRLSGLDSQLCHRLAV